MSNEIEAWKERNLRRVDIAGLSVMVLSEFSQRHLEIVGQRLSKMKMALHRISKQHADKCPGDCIEDSYAYLRKIAAEALEHE